MCVVVLALQAVFGLVEWTLLKAFFVLGHVYIMTLVPTLPLTQTSMAALIWTFFFPILVLKLFFPVFKSQIGIVLADVLFLQVGVLLQYYAFWQFGQSHLLADLVDRFSNPLIITSHLLLTLQSFSA